MTPFLLAIVPLGAIAVILLAVSLAGGRRSARVQAIDDALAAARAADETLDPTDTVVAADGKGALVTTRDRTAVAAVYAIGDRIAARYLTPDDVARVSWTDAEGSTRVLHIDLRDFGCPTIDLCLSAEQAREWRPVLEYCLPSGASAR